MGGTAATSTSASGRGEQRLAGVMVMLLVALAGSIATAVPLFVDSVRERPATGPLVYVHVAFGCAFFVALSLKVVALRGRARPARARRLWTSLVAHIAALLSTYTLVTGVLVMVSAVWADQHLAASFWAVAVVLAHGRHYWRPAIKLVRSLGVSRVRTAKLDRPAGGAQTGTALLGALANLDAGERAFLDLSLMRGIGDDRLARLLRTRPEEVAGRRAALIARLVETLARDAAADVTQARALLREPLASRHVTPIKGRQTRRRLVVIGAGMAGLAVVEEALRDRPANWHVTMLGEEPGVAYNRILLSKLLAGSCQESDVVLRSPSWFDAHGVDLRAASPAASIDVEGRTVVDARGAVHRYDALVLATGSRPVVPPVEGFEGPHVFTFRTRSDVDRIAARARNARAAVVMGGGLLGLEAAAGLLARGVPVTVVEAADRLMAQQLDAQAAATLDAALTRLGIRTLVACRVHSIGCKSVALDDGRELDADLVVVAAGIRPETSLARAAGIETARGVVVDDQMRTSAPAVWSVGECAEHRGTVYGLWAPLADQARVAGASAGGRFATFSGAVPATTLKVAGVDLFAGGAQAASADGNELVWSDEDRGVYRKLVLDGDRLAGALLVGDNAPAAELSELLASGSPVPRRLLAWSADPTAPAANGQRRGDAPEVVCTCRQVRRANIITAIRAGGLTTVPEIARVTGASTGCGGCAPQVEALLAATSEREDELVLTA